MNWDTIFSWFAGIVLTACVLLLAWVVFVEVPQGNARHADFVEYCHKRGGSMEIYSKFYGKTVINHRLCLSKDGRVLDVFN